MLNRKYKLRIGENPALKQENKKESTENKAVGGAIAAPVDGTDVLTLPEETDVKAITFTEHQMTAEVLYTKGEANPVAAATINVYNVSPDTLNKIKENYLIVLEAGYEDEELAVVFSGQIVTMEVGKKGQVDKVLTLVCNGTYLVKKNVRASFTFPKGTTYLTAITNMLDLLASFGLPTGRFYTGRQIEPTDLPKGVDDRLYVAPVGGITIRGYLFDELVSMCKELGYFVYVMNSRIYIEPEQGEPALIVVPLNLNTIKRDIVPKIDNTATPAGGDKPKRGLTLSVFFDYRITLDKLIRLTEGFYAGYYDIESIKIMLDYKGENWHQDLTLMAVKGGK